MTTASIATRIYKRLALIVGVVLLLVGVGALIGGTFARSFIEDQMTKQNIVMPTNEALDSQLKAGRLSQDTVDAIRPYAGQKMSTGAQANAYQKQIGDHMKAAAKAAGLPDATYATLGADVTKATKAAEDAVKAKNPTYDDKQVKAAAQAEIKNPMTTYPEAKRAAELTSLRMETMLNGSTLQGTLLNVYGWSLVGRIATWVGIAALVLGAALVALGVLLRPKADATL